MSLQRGCCHHPDFTRGKPRCRCSLLEGARAESRSSAHALLPLCALALPLSGPPGPHAAPLVAPSPGPCQDALFWPPLGSTPSRTEGREPLEQAALSRLSEASRLLAAPAPPLQLIAVQCGSLAFRQEQIANSETGSSSSQAGELGWAQNLFLYETTRFRTFSKMGKSVLTKGEVFMIY